MSKGAAVDQPGLFNVGRVPNLLTRDLRSVGELLADTDFQSRQVLSRLVPEDAPQLIVGWPSVLFAARDLWAELPPAAPSAGAAERQRLFDRLLANTNGYLTDLRQARPYLGDIEPDSRLLEIADTLSRATKLVRKFGREVDTSREPAKSDVLAAQSRLFHTLFLTIHAPHASTQLLRTAAITRQVVASEVIPGFRGYRLTRVVERLEHWTNRLGSTEAAIARVLDGRYPDQLDGEWIPPRENVVRLPRALATWEIATHNHLAANPSNADIALIARGEEFITAASRHIFRAGPNLGLGEVVEDCEDAAARWASTASWWRVLSPPGSPVHNQLLNAAGELRASIRSLTLDHAAQTQPKLMAQHPGYEPAERALLAALEDGREVARTVREFSRDPNLHGPARSLSRAAQNISETAPGGGGDVVWVSPADTMTNKMIPLPRPLRECLRADVDALQIAAGIVASSATQAGVLPPGAPVEERAAPTQSSTAVPPSSSLLEAPPMGW